MEFLFNGVGMTLFDLCCGVGLSGYAAMLWICDLLGGLLKVV